MFHLHHQFHQISLINEIIDIIDDLLKHIISCIKQTLPQTQSYWDILANVLTNVYTSKKIIQPIKNLKHMLNM